MRPLALLLIFAFGLACSESVSQPEPTVPEEEEEEGGPPPPDDPVPPPDGSARLADPALSTFGVTWGTLTEVTLATIQLRDESGQPVDTVASWPEMEIRGQNAGRLVTVNQISTGLFHAFYVPAEPGFDTLVFTLDGAQVGEGQASDLVRHFQVPAERGVPVVDGALTAGEWSESAMSWVGSEGADSIRVFALSDDDSLYMAVVVPATTFTWLNGLRIRFDSDDNTMLDQGDHAVRVALNGLTDMHYDTLTADDRTEPFSHGSGAAAHDGTYTVFEFAQPLDTGDPLDLALTPGQPVGMCMRYFWHNGFRDYPTDCLEPAEEQRQYGEVVVAN